MPIRPPSPARNRLRQLADSWEQSAAQSDNPDARSRYHKAAAEARMSARDPHLTETGLQMAIAAATAQARFAAWLDGEAIEPATGTLEPAWPCRPYLPTPAPKDRPTEAGTPPNAMNARQLAERFGIVERTARRAIERGVRKGWPGFYRDGCHWYAEPAAFDRARGPHLSELRPNSAPAVMQVHDAPHHTPAAKEGRPQANSAAA